MKRKRKREMVTMSRCSDAMVKKKIAQAIASSSNQVELVINMVLMALEYVEIGK